MELAMCVGLCLVGDYAINFVGDKVHSRIYQMDWETEYLAKHREFIENSDNATEDYIKLTIQNKTDKNLRWLCRQYYSKWTTNYHANKLLQRFHPKIEVNNIGFRRVKNKPIRAEMIRCSSTYALVETGDANGTFSKAYSLTKAKEKSEDDSTVDIIVFYINGKFSYQEYVPHSKDDQKNLENEFLNHHRNNDLQNSVIPSPEIKHLQSLCAKFQSMWSSVTKRESQLTPMYLGFRRIDPTPEPVRVNMLPCGGKYAIMQAEKGSAYLMKKGKYDSRVNMKVFNLFTKLHYKGETPLLDSPVGDQPAPDTAKLSSSSEESRA